MQEMNTNAALRTWATVSELVLLPPSTALAITVLAYLHAHLLRWEGEVR